MTATVADSTPSTGEVATSPDGRTFLLNMSPHQQFAAGSLVSLTDDQGVIRLGQVETRQLLPDGRTQAAGRVLGILNSTGLDDSAMPAFASATVAEADADMITSWNSSAGATLDIGSMSSGSDLPARLIHRRLNRHNFWCGQSGSGKTYALGVLLEEVLLRRC
jgi:uncharacterized protein